MHTSKNASSPKAYRFISDPRHKETLSGRVRAACITCRRKKIKCNGEVPCQTCKEKGLTCEGLAPRKRHKSSVDERKTIDGAIIEQSRLSGGRPLAAWKQISHQSSIPIAIPDPSSWSLKSEYTLSSDSGYSGRKHSSLTEFELSEGPNQAFSRPVSVSYASPLIGPSFPIDPLSWAFVAGENWQGYPASDEPSVRDFHEARLLKCPMGWQGHEDGSTWLPNSPCSQEASPLVGATTSLEAQLASMRWLEDAAALNEARRQTISFPPSSNASRGLLSHQGGPYDDPTLPREHLSQLHGY